MINQTAETKQINWLFGLAIFLDVGKTVVKRMGSTTFLFVCIIAGLLILHHKESQAKPLLHPQATERQELQHLPRHHHHHREHSKQLQYTAAWYGCSIASNLRALQHLVITATERPSLLDFYNICLVWEATNTVESSTHPSQIPFSLFPSGKRYQSLRACADRPDNSFPHQVLRMLNFLPSASEEFCTVIYLFQPPLNVFE